MKVNPIRIPSRVDFFRLNKFSVYNLDESRNRALPISKDMNESDSSPNNGLKQIERGAAHSKKVHRFNFITEEQMYLYLIFY